MTLAAADPTPVGGYPTWLTGDETTGVAFVGHGPDAGREAILAQVLERRLPVAWARQVHGDRVLEAVPGCAGEGDALATDRPEIALAISTADCVPLILGRAGRVVAVHAGWRGIAAGIVPRAVAALAGPATEARAWIGPAIGPCCYEVGADVAAAVREVSDASCVVEPTPGRKHHLDLVTAVAVQLHGAGVARVTRIAACTRCRPELHSHRRNGLGAGRNLAFGWRRDGA